MTFSFSVRTLFSPKIMKMCERASNDCCLDNAGSKLVGLFQALPCRKILIYNSTGFIEKLFMTGFECDIGSLNRKKPRFERTTTNKGTAHQKRGVVSQLAFIEGGNPFE